MGHMMKETPEEKEGILERIHANQDTIRAYGVRKLGLFGSFVRNEQTFESDIDLFIEFGGNVLRNPLMSGFLELLIER